MGLSQTFVAIATFSDGQSREVTNTAGLQWRSSDEGSALVSNDAGKKGVATGVAVGQLASRPVAPSTTRPSRLCPLAVTDAVITGLDIHTPEDPLPTGFSAQVHALRRPVRWQ